MQRQIQVSQHSPTLNTIVMVEETIKKADESLLTVAQLKKRLPRQVNSNTLNTVLEYLEASGKIAVTLKGITWVHNTNANLMRAIAMGARL